MRCFLLTCKTTNSQMTVTRGTDDENNKYIKVIDGKLYVHAETFSEAASVVMEEYLERIEFVGESIVAGVCE